MNIYPNPTSASDINFEILTGDGHTPMAIQMVDLSGRVFFSRLLDSTNLEIKDRIIPMEGLKGGLYFIKLTQGMNTVITKIVIRN